MYQIFNNHPQTSVKCSQGHALTLTNDLRSIDPKYISGTYGCNNCAKTFDSRTHTCAHCIPCEFDLCPYCIQEEERRQNSLNNQATTPVKCSKGHNLTLTNNLRSIDPKYKTGTYGCNLCGRLLNSSTHTCAHCKQCEFDLCPSCLDTEEKRLIMPQNSGNLVACPQGHSLVLTNNLRSIDAKYVTGTYGCNFCGKLFNSLTHTCAHCKPCEFDLCPDCFKGYQNRLLVQQGEPQSNDIVNKFEELSIEEKPKNSGVPVKKEEGKQGNEVISEEKLCVVCLEAEKNHLFIPCGHMCVCEKCSCDVINTKANCPICRGQILNKIRVYL